MRKPSKDLTIKVKKKCCNQCLYSKNKIVSDKRKEQIISEIKTDNDSWFVCHKSQIDGGRDMCQGFYATHESINIQMAQRLGMIRFVD